MVFITLILQLLPTNLSALVIDYLLITTIEITAWIILTCIFCGDCTEQYDYVSSSFDERSFDKRNFKFLKLSHFA